MPIVNRALVKSGFENVCSIVTTFDNGGDTGRMRTDERGRILAFSDYWRSLLSLWQDGTQKENWEEMLRFRDGRGRNFGNTFFQFMSEKAGDLSEVDYLFTKLTGARICGQVIPVSVQPADICFETVSGQKYCGEHYLDDLRMSRDSVKKIWLSKSVRANDEATKAINEAEVIIICPGSMYGSVITNLLPLGIRQAYIKSGAKKILMTNLMSVANENFGFSQHEYVEVFSKYLRIENPIDVVLMADLGFLDKQLMERVLKQYLLEGSEPIVYVEKEEKYKTIVSDIAKIEEQNYRLRHSVTKLSRLFSETDILR